MTADDAYVKASSQSWAPHAFKRSGRTRTSRLPMGRRAAPDAREEPDLSDVSMTPVKMIIVRFRW